MAIREEAFKQHRAGEEEFSNLKRDIDSIRSDIVKLSEVLMDETKTGAKEAYESANRVSQRAIEQAESSISHRPFISLLVSFFLGMILAKVIERR